MIILRPAFGRQYSRVNVIRAFNNEEYFLFKGIPVTRSQLISRGIREARILYCSGSSIIVRF